MVFGKSAGEGERGSPSRRLVLTVAECQAAKDSVCGWKLVQWWTAVDSSWVGRETSMWEPEASVYSPPGPSFWRTRHHKDYPVQRGLWTGGGLEGFSREPLLP